MWLFPAVEQLAPCWCFSAHLSTTSARLSVLVELLAVKANREVLTVTVILSVDQGTWGWPLNTAATMSVLWNLRIHIGVWITETLWIKRKEEEAVCQFCGFEGVDPLFGEGVNLAVFPCRSQPVQCQHSQRATWALLVGMFSLQTPTTVDSRRVYLGCSLYWVLNSTWRGDDRYYSVPQAVSEYR